MERKHVDKLDVGLSDKGESIAFSFVIDKELLKFLARDMLFNKDKKGSDMRVIFLRCIDRAILEAIKEYGTKDILGKDTTIYEIEVKDAS
jgi:hypothetical protein